MAGDRLMAHQDVVPVNPGTEGDWDAPPFAGEIIDGILVGRGALDDKASLITLMEAAEGLAQSGFAPKRTVYFLFGHDEEVAGVGAKSAFALLEERGGDPILVPTVARNVYDVTGAGDMVLAAQKHRELAAAISNGDADRARQTVAGLIDYLQSFAKSLLE